MGMKIKIKELKCQRCGWKWIPRKSDVRLCPHCKSTYWNEPKIKELIYEKEGMNFGA
jgi:predicted Zn-ribbon and HTH transcriptional regulator